jgi:DNA primase
MPLGAEPYNSSYRGVSASTLQHFEAFTCPQKDFDDRIVFPIRNILGQIVGFVARHLYSDEDPKYLVIPEHAKLGLFPANPDIINKSIILVEGIFDMLKLHSSGLTNTVCMFGTSFGNVKKKQRIEENIKKLEQYKLMGASKLYLLLDGDEAGQSAARNMEKNYSKDFIIENIELPEGIDPGSLSDQHLKELKDYLYG